MILIRRLIGLALVGVLALFAAGCAESDTGSDSGSTAAVPATQRPLFINMTTDDSHRASMALSFGKNQQGLGHPLTVFLNDKGVLVGTTANADQYASQQQMISDILAAGGTVLACPMCTEHYGVNPDSYVEGMALGNPELTGSKLFEEGSIALTW